MERKLSQIRSSRAFDRSLAREPSAKRSIERPPVRGLGSRQESLTPIDVGQSGVVIPLGKWEVGKDWPGRFPSTPNSVEGFIRLCGPADRRAVVDLVVVTTHKKATHEKSDARVGRRSSGLITAFWRRLACTIGAYWLGRDAGRTDLNRHHPARFVRHLFADHAANHAGHCDLFLTRNHFANLMGCCVRHLF